MGDAYDIEPTPGLAGHDRLVVEEHARCVTCEASLMGKAVEGACDCGTTVAFSLYGPEAAMSGGAAAVVGSVVCRRCGYDLSGMAASGRCPECSMSVRRSMRGDLLSSSDPGYVAMLARGALIAEWTVILNIVLIVASVFVMSVRPAVGGVMSAALVALNIASLAGWWMLTTRDPALGEADPGGRARRVLRWALVGMIALTALDLALTFAPGQVNPAGGWGVVAIVGLASPVVWLVKMYASLSYMIILDSRLERGRVSEHAERARTILNISLGLIAGTIVVAMFTPCVAILPILALGIFGVVFLVRYVSMLEAAREGLKRARAGAAR